METFSELLLTLYQAAREQSVTEFQDAALNLIKPAVSFDSATWATGRMTPGGLEFFNAHLYQEEPGRLADYIAIKEQDTVAAEAARYLGRTINFHVPTVYAYPDKADIRDYAQRQRHLNGLSTGNTLPANKLLYWIGFYRAEADRQFTETERQFSQYLVPHLQQALMMNWHMHLQQTPQCHSNNRAPAAIIDQQGTLYHFEPDFIELLQLEWPRANDMHLPAQAHQMIKHSFPKPYLGETIVLMSQQINTLLSLRIRKRLPIDELTKRELSVARHVAEGRTYKEVAKLLGISPTTTRNHIQRIHARLRVRNNAELVAQLKQIDSFLQD